MCFLTKKTHASFTFKKNSEEKPKDSFHFIFFNREIFSTTQKFVVKDLTIYW